MRNISIVDISQSWILETAQNYLQTEIISHSYYSNYINVRFFYLNYMSFYLVYKFYMKKILFALLITLALASTKGCSQGQLEIDGKCQIVAYVPGCALYNASGKCGLCQYGYQLQQTKCVYAQKPTTQCCIQTGSDGACTKCSPGLVLNGNSCTKFQRPGCLQGRNFECINCASQYQNIKGRCFRKIPACKNYDESGVCKGCQSSYQLIRGLCTSINYVQLPPNCKQANEYGCSICSQGYYLAKDKTCKRNILGCLKFYRQQCQLCYPEFQLLNGKCFMDGCNQYGNEGCSTCLPPYVLKNGRCAIENCLQSQNGQCRVCRNQFRLKNGLCIKPIADRCTTCANGYFVGQNGRCIKNVESCIKYFDDGKCRQCSTPFVLSGGYCIIPGCERVGPKGCEACFKPLQVSGARCTLQFCTEYNYQTKRCKVCQSGYHVQRGICVRNDPNCGSYSFKSEEEVCARCVSDNFVLTQSGFCQARRPGCVYQYGKCISCASPFKRGPNSQCIIEGCSKYYLEGCQECFSPYEEKRGFCVISNCQQVSKGACIRCSSGFHLSTNKCYENDPNCSAYYGDRCEGCIEGYKLNSKGRCARQIPNCKVLGFDRCEECNAGYQTVSGQCLITDKFCEIFDLKKQGCAKCMIGYHTQAGVCRLNDPTCAIYSEPEYSQKCKQCSKGLIFTADGLDCVKQTPGCVYDNKGHCGSCRKPFIYNQKTCVVPGCSKYSEKGCYQCKYPYVRQGDVCVIPFCDTYDTANPACLTCQGGYKLIQGKCYRQDPKCTEYNKDGKCISCIKQYTIFENVCVRVDSNCLKYSRNGGCNKCKERYYVSPDSLCLPEQPGCVYENGKCTFCNYPFKMHEQSQKCRLDGCIEAQFTGCNKCKYPYELNKAKTCEISNCVTVQDNHCVRCTPGYHLKQGIMCARDEPSCLKYNEDGDCELCDKGYMLMSSGECELAEDNCIEKNKNKQCLACKDEYFLNKFYQCQKKDKNCEEYNNGVCVSCTRRFFLYELICFPYSPGCVSYQGKQCKKCKSAYSLRNGECFNLKKPSLKLQGEDQKYDFEITPIDITKSKYDINNLSPISKLGKVFYSSFAGNQFTDPRLISEEENLFTKGWKAQNARDGEYIGYTINEEEPVTFYAIQIEGVDGNYIKSYYLEYSLDGVNFIRVSKSYDTEITGKNLVTIYFTAIYAKAIRIVVKEYYGWPAARIQFFYYDVLRFRKISNLKSLKYLKESIQSNFVDRMENQIFINERAYFNPEKSCISKDACFTGLQLCAPRNVDSLTVGVSSGSLKKFYVSYSLDGKNFNCFEQCRHFLFNQKIVQNVIILNHLLAKNIRLYPVEWTGSPNVKVTYDYS